MSPYLSAYVGEIDWPRARVRKGKRVGGPCRMVRVWVLARVGSDPTSSLASSARRSYWRSKPEVWLVSDDEGSMHETDGMVSLIDVRDDEGRVDLGSCSTAERLSLYEAVWAASRDRNDRWDRERYARACGL